MVGFDVTSGAADAEVAARNAVAAAARANFVKFISIPSEHRGQTNKTLSSREVPYGDNGALGAEGVLPRT
jgi:hypothetical protein